MSPLREGWLLPKAFSSLSLQGRGEGEVRMLWRPWPWQAAPGAHAGHTPRRARCIHDTRGQAWALLGSWRPKEPLDTVWRGPCRARFLTCMCPPPGTPLRRGAAGKVTARPSSWDISLRWNTWACWSHPEMGTAGPEGGEITSYQGIMALLGMHCPWKGFPVGV